MRFISSCKRCWGLYGLEINWLILGHCRKCREGLEWNFGMLEKLFHDPTPFQWSLFPTRWLDPITSSLSPVVALTAGENPAPGICMAACCEDIDSWSMLSMRDRCSRINLSPASSLIPGSRYTHSALSSMQSLHLGRDPSQRDLRERHTSHWKITKQTVLIFLFSWDGVEQKHTAMIARRRGFSTPSMLCLLLPVVGPVFELPLTVVFNPGATPPICTSLSETWLQALSPPMPFVPSPPPPPPVLLGLGLVKFKLSPSLSVARLLSRFEAASLTWGLDEVLSIGDILSMQMIGDVQPSLRLPLLLFLRIPEGRWYMERELDRRRGYPGINANAFAGSIAGDSMDVGVGGKSPRRSSQDSPSERTTPVGSRGEAGCGKDKQEEEDTNDILYPVSTVRAPVRRGISLVCRCRCCCRCNAKWVYYNSNGEIRNRKISRYWLAIIHIRLEVKIKIINKKHRSASERSHVQELPGPASVVVVVVCVCIRLNFSMAYLI